MSDEQPGDVRDTLSGLERRLREMEGDLRSGAGEPGTQTTAAGGTGKDGPGGGGGGRPRLSGLLIAGVGAAALLIVVLVAVLASSGGSSAGTSSGPSEIVLGAGVSESGAASALAKLGGVRAARGNAAAEACAGSAGAALVIVQPAPKTVGCAGLKELVTMTVSATGLAQRGGAKRCLRASQVTAQLRRPGALTRQRAARVLKARRAAAAKAIAGGSSKAAAVNAERRGAAIAASNFDSARKLTLAKVRGASGRCVAPTAGSLRDGTYPLSVRVSLLARPGSTSNPAVIEAESTLRKALSGAVPVEAAVRGG